MIWPIEMAAIETKGRANDLKRNDNKKASPYDNIIFNNIDGTYKPHLFLTKKTR